MKHDDITPLEIQYRHSNETQNYIQINSQYWLALYFTRVGLRLRSASGGPESPDFCSVHAVNQGIDIPHSPNHPERQAGDSQTGLSRHTSR